MGTRKVPDKNHASGAEWSDKKVERFASYSQLALNHAMGRNARVVQILCYVSMLRNAGDLRANANFMVVAAHWQNYGSVDDNQAAHYLPGQLLVDFQKLSEFPQNPQIRTSISCLFGDVEDLPADFNKADTQAEDKGNAEGLCGAFAEALRHVNDHASGSAANLISRDAVRTAYQTIWVPRARIAFDRARQAKGGKFTRPEIQYGAAGGVDYDTILNLGERESASDYQNRIDNQLDILRHYIASLTKLPLEFKDTYMNALENSFISGAITT